MGAFFFFEGAVVNTQKDKKAKYVLFPCGMPTVRL